MRLNRLFSPRSIVIIGGGAWGENVARHNRKLGYEGEIWVVHPKGKEIAGIPAFTTLDQLPGVPDAAYICVNRHAAVEAMRQLSQMGCGGAVCLAAGFSEAAQEDANAHSLQQALVEAAGSMPFLGPNCYGFINFCDQLCLWPDQHGGIARDQGVAVLAQSSNIAMNMTFLSCGLPLSHMFAIGNQAQTGMAEVALALLDDPRVKAIGLHIEGIKRAQEFETLAHKAQRLNKPIVVLKVGRSDAAQQATLSHTASLAGNHQAAEAFFARCGFISTHSLPEFVEALKLAVVVGLQLDSNQISSISCSGGEASVMADTALDYDIELPALSVQTKQQLRAALGEIVALANPLDYNTYIWRNEDKLCEVFTAMGQAGHGINLIILDYPRSDRCDDFDWQTVEKACVRAKALSGARFGIVSTLHNNMREERAEHLISHGIVPFAGINEALNAIARFAKRKPPHNQGIALAPALSNPQRFEERAAKALLAQAGLQVPHAVLVEGKAGLAAQFERLGAPVVLKGQGFAHKSENNAVVLNISTPQALMDAANGMKTDSFLLEQMVQGVKLELLVGITQDPCFGTLLTLGAGGIYTEILRDTASLLLPASRDEVRQTLFSLACAPRLSGYRGQAPLAVDAVLDAVMALQGFVLARAGKISEIEINPLAVGVDFACVLDALLSAQDLDKEQV